MRTLDLKETPPDVWIECKQCAGIVEVARTPAQINYSNVFRAMAWTQQPYPVCMICDTPHAGLHSMPFIPSGGWGYCDTCYMTIANQYGVTVHNFPMRLVEQHGDRSTLQCLMCNGKQEGVRMIDVLQTTETPVPTGLVPVRQVYIRGRDPENYILYFNGDDAIAKEARRYGSVKVTGDYAREYRMFVDGCYDFEEVVAFIEGLGDQSN